MPINNPQALLRRLLEENRESEWLEFKHNNSNPDLLGEYASACANSAMLLDKERAYIVFGIEDGTKNPIGTTISIIGHTSGPSKRFTSSGGSWGAGNASHKVGCLPFS